MKIMAVRNYNGHFENQQGKYTKIKELFNLTRQVKNIAMNIYL